MTFFIKLSLKKKSKSQYLLESDCNPFLKVCTEDVFCIPESSHENIMILYILLEEYPFDIRRAKHRSQWVWISSPVLVQGLLTINQI